MEESDEMPLQTVLADFRELAMMTSGCNEYPCSVVHPIAMRKYASTSNGIRCFMATRTCISAGRKQE